MYDIHNFSKRYGMYFFYCFTDKTFAHFILKGHLPDKEKVVL